MAVRFRKYFNQCKPIQCTGKRNKLCPQDLPCNKQNGELRRCGSWFIEFFDSNKQWQSLTFKDVRNRTDAEKRLSLFITDRERGRLNLPSQGKIPTLGKYGKKYLERYTTAKENTLAVKVRTVNILTAYLGDYRLDKITAFVVEKFRIDRKEKDKVKDGTINDDVVTLSHILSKAIEDGLIDKNPYKGIKKLKVESKRDRILSSEETSILLNKLQGKDRIMVLFGLFCGLRLNETIKLTWDDVDFAKGLLSFVASKTGRLVTVPLSVYMIRELDNYKVGCKSNKLFEDRKVDTDVVKEYSKHFSDMFKGLNLHGFTYHCLRHTFASLQADLGVGTITTMGLLGHSSLDMTLRYSHTGLDSKRQAIEAMTEHVISGAKNDSLPLTLNA